MGNNKFIHAPRTGKNIEVANMAQSYWTGRYNGARRVNRATASQAADTSDDVKVKTAAPKKAQPAVKCRKGKKCKPVAEARSSKKSSAKASKSSKKKSESTKKSASTKKKKN
jgi:hypothetical protein